MTTQHRAPAAPLRPGPGQGEGGDQASSRTLGWSAPVEGACLVFSGLLFATKAGLEVLVKDPPPAPEALTAWRSTHQAWLATTNEVMFFAVGLLVPGLIGLYRRLGSPRRGAGAWGCALFAALVPVMMTLTIVHGRLAYPVYGIDVHDAASVALVVSLYYGGQHAVSLLLGLTLILLTTALRRTPNQQPTQQVTEQPTGSVLGPATVYLGFIAAAAQFAGAYPWLIGLWPAAGCQVLLAVWLTIVGAQVALSPTSSDRAGTPQHPPAAPAPEPHQ